MKLALFDDFRLGLVTDRGVVDASSAVRDLAQLRPGDLMNELIEHFDDFRPGLAGLADEGNAVPMDKVRLRAPLPQPRNIVCMAVNYMENGTRSERPALSAFPKSPNAILGPEETMVLPDVEALVFEGEAELALVVGKHASHVPAGQAYDYIFGYVNFIDGSARMAHPTLSVFYEQKSRDTFAPIGPYIVTADEVEHPQARQVRLWVNGVLKQEFSTADMGNSIPSCIEWVTSVHALEPGDILATGTNHLGLGAFQDGDVVELENEGLGRLRIHVKDELRRTWSRQTRQERAMAGAEARATMAPQLTGKYSNVRG
jgi:2-keto-4-pentenoate hydratase/2-oxohepta-3-ene-1,7-dioic acid hydratase in catechol pathway